MVLDMETSYTTTVDQTRLARGEEYSLSVESDMMEADSLHELGHSYQDVEMQTELERVSPHLLPLRRFMDIDGWTCSDEYVDEYVDESLLTTAPLPVTACQNSSKPKCGGPYRRYTAHQVERLFNLVIEEGKTAKADELITGINIRTAQNYIKKYNDDEERRLPFNVRKVSSGRKPNLTQVHSQFLIEIIDKHPSAVLHGIRQALYQEFPELSISISSLYRYLVQTCGITLKKHQKLPSAKNSDRLIKLRKGKVEEWEYPQNWFSHEIACLLTKQV
jgi:transposase